MKKIVSLLALVLAFALCTACAEGAWNDPENYRSIFNSVKYDDGIVYVIGHKSPDTDTVASAIGYADFRRQLGLNCEARVSDKPNSETAFALNYFGLEAPEILTDAAGLQMILVDQNESSQSIDGMAEATIREIIDHHNLGDFSDDHQILQRFAPVGATATLVYLCYKECGLEIPPQIAGMLASAIMSDTGNLQYAHTAMDEAALEELCATAGIDDREAYYIALDTAKCDFGDMTDEEIFFSDYKEYSAGDYRYGIGCVSFRGEDQLEDLCVRMQNTMEEVIDGSGMNMLFTLIHEKNSGKQYLLSCGKYALDAAKLAEFGTLEGDRILIVPSVSRKTVIVPGLAEILENVNLEEAA